MSLEVDDTIHRARFHRIKDKDLNSVIIPREISKHLDLGEKGDLGFKKVRYKGRKYVLVAELRTEI